MRFLQNLLKISIILHINAMTDMVAGHRKRLKERFMISPESLPDYEILELVLFNALPRRDVKILAKSLISQYGNFAKVINFDENHINESDEISPSVNFQFQLLKESLKRLLKENISQKTLLNNWNALYDYLQADMGHLNIEHFRILYLNTKNFLIADEVHATGTIDQASVYPREILKKAIFHGAASVILAHNHPSGVTKPSKSDIIITTKIMEACKMIDVNVHDHIIIAGNDVFSFKSNNLL